MEEWKQLPSQPVMVWRRSLCGGLKEVRSDSQVVLMLILDLDLTHWEPHHLRLMDRNSCLRCFLVSWLPHVSLVARFTSLEFVAAHFSLIIPWRDICLLSKSLTSGLSSRLTRLLFIYLCGFVRAGVSTFYCQYLHKLQHQAEGSESQRNSPQMLIRKLEMFEVYSTIWRSWIWSVLKSAVQTRSEVLMRLKWILDSRIPEFDLLIK